MEDMKQDVNGLDMYGYPTPKESSFKLIPLSYGRFKYKYHSQKAMLGRGAAS